MSDPEFESSLLTLSELSDIYRLIGLDYLNDRYSKIIDGLKNESIDYLKSLSSAPSDFLINTGIVRKEKDGFVLLNKLFEYYISCYSENFSTDIDTVDDIMSRIKARLSGQEVLVFDLLYSREGAVVSKDAIAKEIWNDAWKDKYSDWSIDKLISNISKKLKDCGYHKTIKSLKGQGVMLV